MFVQFDMAGAASTAVASLVRPSGACFPMTVERIGGSGIEGRCEAPLLAGEAIQLTLPGIGEMEATVLTSGRNHFTAEWQERRALRLSFLNGWNGVERRRSAR